MSAADYPCPSCGLAVRSVKPPGLTNPGEWDGPVMCRPCTCVVEQEALA